MIRYFPVAIGGGSDSTTLSEGNSAEECPLICQMDVPTFHHNNHNAS